MPIATRMCNRIRSCSLLFGVLLFPACERETRAETSSQRVVVTDVILTVVNRSQRTARVSLELDTLDHLLGAVAVSASRSFSLPSVLLTGAGVFRLKAVRDGAQPVRSETFQVSRGQKLVWTFADSGRGTVVMQ